MEGVMLKEFALASMLLSSTAYAAEGMNSINTSTPYKQLKEGITVKNGIAYLYGDITDKLDENFSHIPQNVTKLILTSPGGYVREGISIAEQVKARNMSTIVIGYCYSACTIIFAAGKQKIAKHDADFIVHSAKPVCPRKDDNCLFSDDEIQNAERSNRTIISEFDAFDVDGSFIRSAVKWPQKQNEKRFGAQLAKDIRLATHIMPDRATETLLSFFDSNFNLKQFEKIPKPVVISVSLH